MKKVILCLAGMLCFGILTHGTVPPLTEQIFDDAVRGSGIGQHQYVGSNWIFGKVTHTFYQSTHSASTTKNAYMIFTFTGSKFEWFTEKKYTHGIVAISIDSGPEMLIDLYSPTEQHLIVYTSPLLDQFVTHTFKMRVTGTKNPASSNYYGIHDYIKVYYGLDESGPTNTSLGEGTFKDVVAGGATNNSAFGYGAIAGVYAGSDNTAVGAKALPGVYYGYFNTAIGSNAMNLGAQHTGSNTAVGAYAMSTGIGGLNTALGAYTEVGGSNTTAIGYAAKTSASNQVRIGNWAVTSIGGQVSWSTLSDGRFKKDLREDVAGLDFINSLRPVSYTVDNNAVRQFLGVSDSLSIKPSAKEQSIRQTGFVAQEVDKILKKSKYAFNGVDVPKNENDPYTIRYAEFVVPLVKAVQEMSIKLDDQQQQITELLAQIAEKENDGSKSKTELMLFQNNPNPFSVDTEIKMTLPETTASARVIVYNLEGKQLKEVTVKERGSASVKIVANELGAGMYIYALIVDGKVVDTKRMILTK
jgi:hypothetical protein